MNAKAVNPRVQAQRTRELVLAALTDSAEPSLAVEELERMPSLEGASYKQIAAAMFWLMRDGLVEYDAGRHRLVRDEKSTSPDPITKESPA